MGAFEGSHGGLHLDVFAYKLELALVRALKPAGCAGEWFRSFQGEELALAPEHITAALVGSLAAGAGLEEGLGDAQEVAYRDITLDLAHLSLNRRCR
jgi:hypothetical protein